MSKKPAPPLSPINVALTIVERDAIDAAKGRLRRLIAITRKVTGSESEDSETEDSAAEIEDLLDVMAEDIATIDATFKAADGRQRVGAA